MLPADNLEAALAQEKYCQDERVSQYWDGERAIGQKVAQLLNLSIPTAWDVYLLYLPNRPWNDCRLHLPDFWLHQLDERPDLRLDPDRLMAEVERALAETSIKE